MRFYRWLAQIPLWAALALAASALSCSGAYKKDADVATSRCTNVDATVAYYYRYKDATPDQSDIAFIEVVPPGPRCVVPSSKRAPVFPDSAISGYVAGRTMKIDVPNARTVAIQGNADLAVYYKADTPVAPLARTPVAVENLAGVSRTIDAASVADTGSGAPSCGNCRSYPCDGYICCKPPPCP